MNNRNRQFYIFIPIVQVAFYVAAYELTNYMAHKMNMVYSRGVAWGISATDYFIKYTLIIIALTILNLVIRKFPVLLSVSAAILFFLLVSPVLDYYPYRGGLVILIGVAGILSKNFLDYSLKRFLPSTPE